MEGAMSDPGLRAYRASVRAWLSQAVFPKVGSNMEETYAANRAWHKQLAQAGWLGVNWPVEYGGQGLSTLHQMAAMEELARGGAPLPLAIVNLYVVGPTLVSWASQAQKQRFLKALLHADEIWCQGFSEPNAGSDLASLKTRALPDGSDFIINGQKIWTSQAQCADYCAVLARTDTASNSHAGLSYFIVDMKSPGIRVRPIEQLTGDAMFNEVFFENVRVPAANIIGELNEGWKVAMRSLASERSIIMAQRKAEADAMFQWLLQVLKSRYPKGEGLPPHLSWRLGHARMQLAALDAQVRDLVDRLQRGSEIAGEESLDKLILTDVEQEVFALAFDQLGPYRQVPGGRPPAMDAAHMIHEFFYSRSRSISGGTTQIQRDIVAKRLLKLPSS